MPTQSLNSVQVLEEFTGSDIFGLEVLVPAAEMGDSTLPSDLSNGIQDAPAIDYTLSWKTFSEASEENGGPSICYRSICYRSSQLTGRGLLGSGVVGKPS